MQETGDGHAAEAGEASSLRTLSAQVSRRQKIVLSAAAAMFVFASLQLVRTMGIGGRAGHVQAHASRLIKEWLGDYDNVDSGSLGEPTLYCWAVVRRDSYEVSLVQEQQAHNAGIFSCDSTSLISDGDLGIPGARTLTIGSTDASGYSKDGTTANAAIFIDAWYAIHYDGEYMQFDWIVKADPDAVVVPARLREKLALPDQKPVPLTHPGRPCAGPIRHKL